MEKGKDKEIRSVCVCVFVCLCVCACVRVCVCVRTYVHVVAPFYDGGETCPSLHLLVMHQLLFDCFGRKRRYHHSEKGT